MDEHIFFAIGLSCILIHEMDAVRCKEWRIFPGLSLLDDRWGYRVFSLLHIPLFAWLLYGLMGPDPDGLRHGLDVFFMVHLGLHIGFLLHPKNEFRDWISWTFIVGAALGGALDLYA